MQLHHAWEHLQEPEVQSNCVRERSARIEVRLFLVRQCVRGKEVVISHIEERLHNPEVEVLPNFFHRPCQKPEVSNHRV